MSVAVQITLIICVTVVALAVICGEKEGKDGKKND